MQRAAQNLERVISFFQTGSTGLPQVFSSFLCSLHVQERERKREKQYGGDQQHSREETGGLGERARGDDEVEGGQGCKSLKISHAAEHKAGPRQSSSIPSISAIFVAFSIMSEVCLIS